MTSLINLKTPRSYVQLATLIHKQQGGTLGHFSSTKGIRHPAFLNTHDHRTHERSGR